MWVSPYFSGGYAPPISAWIFLLLSHFHWSGWGAEPLQVGFSLCQLQQYQAHLDTRAGCMSACGATREPHVGTIWPRLSSEAGMFCTWATMRVPFSGGFVKEGSDEFFPIHRVWLIAGILQMLLFPFPLHSVPGASRRQGFHDDLLLNDLLSDLWEAQCAPAQPGRT